MCWYGAVELTRVFHSVTVRSRRTRPAHGEDPVAGAQRQRDGAELAGVVGRRRAVDNVHEVVHITDLEGILGREVNRETVAEQRVEGAGSLQCGEGAEGRGALAAEDRDGLTGREVPDLEADLVVPDRDHAAVGTERRGGWVAAVGAARRAEDAEVRHVPAAARERALELAGGGVVDLDVAGVGELGVGTPVGRVHAADVVAIRPERQCFGGAQLPGLGVEELGSDQHRDRDRGVGGADDDGRRAVVVARSAPGRSPRGCGASRVEAPRHQ